MQKIKYLILADITTTNIIEKIKNIFEQDIFTILALSLSLLLSFIGSDRLYLMCIVLSAMSLDLLWGFLSSIKRKRWACSTFATASAIKLLVYGSFMALSGLIDKSFGNDFLWASNLTCGILCISEFISVCAHILIVKPNTPIVKLLKKALEGEMAKKLNINSDSFQNAVENVCKEDSKKSCNDCRDCSKEK